MEENDQLTQLVTLGTSIGRSQAFGLLCYKCSAEQAHALQHVWESGSYKLLGITWEQYCLDYAGLSHQRVEGIIRNLKEFGDIYLRLSEIVAISPQTYRRLQPKVHHDCLEIEGEMVPILPENAARIRETVHRLRAELRRAEQDLDTLTSPTIASLQTRLESWLTDLRRLAPHHDHPAFRGLLQYSVYKIQEIDKSICPSQPVTD